MHSKFRVLTRQQQETTKSVLPTPWTLNGMDKVGEKGVEIGVEIDLRFVFST